MGNHFKWLVHMSLRFLSLALLCVSLVALPSYSFAEKDDGEGMDFSGGDWMDPDAEGDDNPAGQFNKCKGDAGKAVNSCVPGRSPELAKGIQTVDQITQVAGAMLPAMGGNIACGTLGKAMNAANGAMAGYKLACALGQDTCDDTCGGARKTFYGAKYAVENLCKDKPNGLSNKKEYKIPNAKGKSPNFWTLKASEDGQSISISGVGTMTIEQFKSHSVRADICGNKGNIESAYGNLKKAKSKCNGYKANITDALPNMMQFLMGQMMAKQCEQELETASEEGRFCDEFPESPVCKEDVADICADPSMATTPQCACKNNPNDPNCKGTTRTDEGSVSEGASIVGDFPGSATNASKLDDELDNLFGGKAGITGVPEPGSGQSASTNGGSGTGSGRGLGNGGGGGGGGKGRGRGGLQASSLPDVNMKTGGGSRGGSGFGGSGFRQRNRNRGGRKAASRGGPNLKAFLPGGKKDPNQKSEISGAAGPSNWSKITERYRANQSTLSP